MNNMEQAMRKAVAALTGKKEPEDVYKRQMAGCQKTGSREPENRGISDQLSVQCICNMGGCSGRVSEIEG